MTPARGRARLLGRLAVACLVGGLVAAGVLTPVGAGLDALSTQMPAVRPDPLGGVGASQVPLATTVTDRAGTPIATLYEQYRVPLSYHQIAPAMDAAILAAEDRRFFTESALDPSAIVRALLHDAGGGSLQGASTITQQYVKNYLIDVVDRNDPAAQAADRADTVGRKVREAVLALQLGNSASKQDILAGYLNLVEFSGTVFGVGSAAQAYFGTNAGALSVPQAALLAAMVNNPNLYDPYTHPRRALERRNVVLDAMVQGGSLSPAAAGAAKAAPLGVLPGGPVTPGGTCMSAAPDAGFFCSYALAYLRRAGFTTDQLATGGYTIRTSLDPTASRAAKDAVDRNVATTQDGVANTFALLRPGRFGHQVLAMVANRNYGTDPSQGQTGTDIVADPSNVFGAGSVFKIFTTAAALQAGTVGYDTPLPDPTSACFPPPDAAPSTSCYPVHNYSSGYPDPISLQKALATSPNVPFVGLEARVGVPAVIDMARRLGLRDSLAANDVGATPVTDPTNPLSSDPQYNQPQSRYYRNLLSFTLGASPVSTLEMANVSATILSGGTWCPPDPILTVTDRTGRPVPVAQQPCQQVIPPGLARTLAAGLSKDTTIGTSAAAANAAGWTRPGIGKTGTTSAGESATFVGGADGYAAASMVFADGAHPQQICPGPPVHLGTCSSGAFGGTVAAPPYFAAMSTLLAGRPDQPVPTPDPRYLEPGPHLGAP
ncbi:MAG: penicillin-binding protein [Pseudonocardia sp.]|nr:penicillin-binding protein [Pseudonocardia sp.]